MHKAHRKSTRIDLFETGLPIIDMPIPSAWHDLARQKGMRIIARVQDRYHLALACGQCGKPSRHKIYALRVSQPQCPHCLESQWRADARKVGLEFLRRDTGDNMYSWYRAPCGHDIRRQPDRMRQIGVGRNGLRCETCHAAVEAAEAEARGWTLIGPDSEGNVNYRIYEHDCGHRQRIARANLQRERFSCACCGESWSSAPSWIYLLRLSLPGYGPVVKAGYSRNPESRMRFQLGVTGDLGCKLVVKIAMPTGHDAIRAEKRLHADLRSTYPEAVLPPEIITPHLNVVSEVYSGTLESVIRAELKRIASRATPS